MSVRVAQIVGENQNDVRRAPRSAPVPVAGASAPYAMNAAPARRPHNNRLVVIIFVPFLFIARYLSLACMGFVNAARPTVSVGPV